jgi:hypothetical protein
MEAYQGTRVLIIDDDPFVEPRLSPVGAAKRLSTVPVGGYNLYTYIHSRHCNHSSKGNSFYQPLLETKEFISATFGYLSCSSTTAKIS